jgi:hypothetical protein
LIPAGRTTAGSTRTSGFGATDFAAGSMPQRETPPPFLERPALGPWGTAVQRAAAASVGGGARLVGLGLRRSWPSERNPRPLNWHKSAEKILDRLADYCRSQNKERALQPGAQGLPWDRDQYDPTAISDEAGVTLA